MTSKKTDLVLGYDFGTSSVKAALFDRDGRIHAWDAEGYPLSLPQPGWAEQDPNDWWRAMGAVTHRLLAAAPRASERIVAMGVAAQICGTIAVDRDGTPLHPCLIAMDTRSAPIARSITSGGPRIAGYGVARLMGWLWLANGAPNLAGRDPLTKILWLREARPALWAHTAHVTDVKDWLIHRLTGHFTTTPDVAHLTWLMDNRVGKREWADAYLTRFNLGRALLPAIIDADAVAGTLTAAAAEHLGLRAGVPVAGGVGDLNACALAAGNHEIGAYHLCLGTSMWLGAHARGRRVDPWSGVATLCAAARDRYLLVASQECAGAAVQWAAAAWGFGDGTAGARAMDAAAIPVKPHTDTPLFLPWLIGERVPVDDPHLRGGLAGASLRTTRADIAYAVLAGVALNARWAFAKAARCVAPAATPLRLIGGGAASATWVRVVADMLQQPLQIVEHPALGGARGAAMTAARVAGWYGSFEDAASMTRVGPLVEPDRTRQSWADERYHQLIDYWRATRRWHGRFAVSPAAP